MYEDRYRRHNYIYLLKFKVLMELIIIVFLKSTGAAISGHWETQGLRETMTLLCGLLSGSMSVGPYLARRCACAHSMGAVWPDSPAKPTMQKRHILASRTCSAANMAVPTDS